MMKRVFPAILTTMLLSACPDSRVPKEPPRVPEPKIESTYTTPFQGLRFRNSSKKRLAQGEAASTFAGSMD
jgi:hypothetical protein